MNHYCLYCDGRMEEVVSWETLLFRLPSRCLCRQCKGKLLLIAGRTCRICSRPLADIAKQYVHNDMCTDCVHWEREPQWANVLERNISLFRYNHFLKKLIARFKYRGDYALAKAFSHNIHSTLIHLQFDYLVPIPLSEERLLERGFNQAKALAEEAGLKVTEALLRVHGEKQSKKSRTERIHLPQVFQPADEINITGKSVILVDDIYTTGSTLRHAALVLKQGGAKSIISFTLARG